MLSKEEKIFLGYREEKRYVVRASDVHATERARKKGRKRYVVRASDVHATERARKKGRTEVQDVQ